MRLPTIAAPWLLIAMVITNAAYAHDGEHAPLPQPPPLAQAATPIAVPSDTASCAFTVRVNDASTGATLPALIHLTNAEGETIRPPELLPRTTALSTGSLGDAAFAYMDRWSVLPGERTISLPQGALTLTVFSGLEFQRVTVPLALTGKTSANTEIGLTRLPDVSAPGEFAGNVHLHLQKMTLPEAERYVTETAVADGLDLVYLSYLERPGADVNYISNTFTAQDLERFRERSGVLFGYGEEYRHNFPRAEGYGHVMFLDLPKLVLPASLGPDIMKQGKDDGILRTGIEAARAQAATVLWCHNARGLEDIPSWVAGLLDGQIIFDGGATGGYEQGFYPYLNIGLHVPIAMGTDWFLNDMAATMVRVEGPLSSPSWLAALRAGRSYITNGPLLEFEVDGAQAGATISPGTGESVRVRARSRCRNDFLSLELVANGVVVARTPSALRDGVFEAELELDVPIEESAWLAVRTLPFEVDYDRPEAVSLGFNEYGKPLFAHTSPVYVQVDGKPVLVPESAESLIAELRSSMVTIRSIGDYSSDAEREKVLAIYEEARAALVTKLGR